jgi:hypothetical protein
MIDLENLDNSKDEIHQVIGISEIELTEYFHQIYKEHTPETLLKELGFSPQVIFNALEKTKRTSEAVKRLWESKGRKKIPIKKFLETFILLKQIDRSPTFIEWLRERALTEEAIKIVRKQGIQPMMNTSHCIEWKEKEKRCNGCISEPSCLKVLLIKKTLKVRDKYQPKDFFDFLKMEQWIDLTQRKILQAKNKKALLKIFIP